MQLKCDICKSDKRSIKFLTRRIKICQWCVSFLCKQPIDPGGIESKINRKIYRYVSNLPNYKIPCRRTLRKGIIKDIGDTRLLDKAILYIFYRDEYNKRDKLIESKINDLVIEYENKIKSECNNLLKDILEWNNVPKQLSGIGLYTPRFFYSEIVERKYIKYINAIQKRLIAGKEKIFKPSEAQWRLIRK